MGVCSHGFVALFVTVGVLVIFYVLCKEEEEEEKRGERQNIMKKTHLSIFLTMKRERWVTGGPMEVTLGRLSDNF